MVRGFGMQGRKRRWIRLVFVVVFVLILVVVFERAKRWGDPNAEPAGPDAEHPAGEARDVSPYRP